MGVGAGLYMCDVVKKFTFAISSPDDFLLVLLDGLPLMIDVTNHHYCYSTPNTHCVCRHDKTVEFRRMGWCEL